LIIKELFHPLKPPRHLALPCHRAVPTLFHIEIINKNGNMNRRFSKNGSQNLEFRPHESLDGLRCDRSVENRLNIDDGFFS
jgi:hypothetical protein